ncbi:MAG TPA: tryptophan--tRNA ligase [Chitinispirillaceae bacterium]|nr:tryptophan--tRNA ligase [Chitinispirillaceae bacterium]
MRILSGIKPSGTIHIGNYLGMIRPMVEAQKRGELFCFIANLHSLTTLFNAKEMLQNTHTAFVELLALGIDPEKSLLWVQSDVPAVTELTWYLNNVTPVGLLERCHAYKDAIAKGIPPSNGLFCYPVLMAADILAFQSDVVPVGKDQKQHLEVSRDIAIKFNMTYGEAFTVPEPQIEEAIAVIPGTDGQKMSKSYDNIIPVFGEEKAIRKRIMGIVTDATPVEAPKDPDKSTIFAIYKQFATPEQINALAGRFRAGGMGYGDAKKELFEMLWNYFAPFRQKRRELDANLDYVAELRKKGKVRAEAIATETIEKVRKLVGITG